MTNPHLAPPLSPGRALLLFGASAAPFWFGIYLALPWLVRRGVPVSLALSVAALLPLAILLVAAVVAGRRERPSPDWEGLRHRWRMGPFRWADVGWGALLLTVTLLGYFTLAGTADWFQGHLGLTPPPEFDLVRTETTFWGVRLTGNWWAVALHLGILVLNVTGEELWFRGIIFPRQEAEHGPRAWWIHGLCYHGFHMFYPWDVIRLLPESLMYGWVAQRSKSVYPSLISHFLFNGLGLMSTIAAVVAA